MSLYKCIIIYGTKQTPEHMKMTVFFSLKLFFSFFPPSIFSFFLFMVMLLSAEIYHLMYCGVKQNVYNLSVIHIFVIPRDMNLIIIKYYKKIIIQMFSVEFSDYLWHTYYIIIIILFFKYFSSFPAVLICSLTLILDTLLQGFYNFNGVYLLFFIILSTHFNGPAYFKLI